MQNPILKRVVEQCARLSAALSSYADLVERTGAVVDLRNEDLVPVNQVGMMSRVFRQLSYLDDMPATGSLNLYGSAQVSSEAIAFAEHINKLKNDVKLDFMALRKDLPVHASGVGSYLKRDPQFNALLASAGLARLNLRHVYRHLPIAARGLTRIGFSWTTKSRRIVRVSRQEAMNYLLRARLAADVKEEGYELVQSLPASSVLALVSPISTTMVANLWFERQTKPILIRAPLPILIPSNIARPSVVWCCQPDSEPLQRHTRSDRRLEADPVVPGARLYKYLQNAM